jgi:thiamine biosynthesis protein ThiS
MSGDKEQDLGSGVGEPGRGVGDGDGKGEEILLRVNGQDRRVPAGTTVAELLASLELVPGMVVVERNREIVDRSRYVEVELEPGDVLELVHFVGGG